MCNHFLLLEQRTKLVNIFPIFLYSVFILRLHSYYIVL